MNPDEQDSSYFNKLTSLERKILEFRAINLSGQMEVDGHTKMTHLQAAAALKNICWRKIPSVTL